MSLAGTGIVAIWNDMRPGSRDAVYEWHNREHIPERVGIPGFLRGRRFIAVEGSPEFFILYETKDPSAASGPAYFERLNNPTPWTVRTNKNFLNTIRGICAVVATKGQVDGGAMLTLRFDPPPDRQPALREALAALLPAVVAEAGILSASLCIAEREKSLIETVERIGRAPLISPSWILLIEGMSITELAGIAERHLAEPLEGCAVERGLYRLEISLSRPLKT
ncbi:MAG: hypothetical protein JWP20_2380 [Roseomonas sp.]|nr:hypothetical protein [Roseomonas sp.]